MDNWFRIVAFFVYSPLAVFLVIILPDVVFPIALAVAGYANLQLMASLAPRDPYDFGPDTPEAFAEAVADVEGGSGDGAETGTETATDSGGGSTAGGTSTAEDPDIEQPGNASEVAPPGAEPTAADGESTERGILPGFMRRL